MTYKDDWLWMSWGGFYLPVYGPLNKDEDEFDYILVYEDE